MIDRFIKGVKPLVKKIIVSDKIYFHKRDIIAPDEFDAVRRKYLHKSIDGTFYCTLEEHENGLVSLPNNAWWTIDYEEFEDHRVFPKIAPMEFTATLRPEQLEVAEAFLKTKSGEIRSGIYQAKCGWGKTFVACYQISKAQVSTLILVHTKLLFYQWQTELEKQIKGLKAGMIGAGIYDPRDITVGIYLSVNNRIPELKDKFGLIYCDEVHHTPARLFSETLNSFSAKKKIGISATPRRKDGKHIILPEYFTPYKVIAKDHDLKQVYYTIVPTDISFNVINPKKEWAKAITALCANIPYLKFIVEYAIKDISNKRCPLIITDRIESAKILSKLIPNAGLMIGEVSDDDREEILKGIGTKYKCVVTTKLFNEAVSAHRLDTLYFTCPSGNDVNWEQRIGRLERDHLLAQDPLVRDFHVKGMMVYKQQARRLDWYKKQGYKEWKS